MIINGKRALAYIVQIDETRPLEGYDRVKYARTNGWWCIVNVDELNTGDKAVYFEVDSLVPSTDKRFSFMAKRNYKVKTLKMCKVYSQGLLMPLKVFPELRNMAIGTDVTDKLGIKYAEAEDNTRKASVEELRTQSMNSRYKQLTKKKFWKWMMHRSWGRKILLFIFGKKKNKPKSFPTQFSYINKTDEERIENCPWMLESNDPWIITEKLDGTSSTYILERKKHNKFEFYVCSRSVRQLKESQECYHDYNIYWEMAKKYSIEKHLKEYLQTYPNLDYVCIQGESVGKVQGNPLKLNEDRLYVYNFIRSDVGRISSIVGKNIVEGWGMNWVPILNEAEWLRGEGYYLPKDLEEFKQYATNKSVVNPSVMREGIVCRNPKNNGSFKNVSREYLLKHGG